MCSIVRMRGVDAPCDTQRSLVGLRLKSRAKPQVYRARAPYFAFLQDCSLIG